MSPETMSPDLFPAHAGMNRCYRLERQKRASVPRTRGDEPLRHLNDGIGVGCSPHTRG